MTKTSEGGAATAPKTLAINIFAARMDAWGLFRSDGRKPPPGGDEAVAWYLEGLDRKRMRAVADELLADARVPRGGERMNRAHGVAAPPQPRRRSLLRAPQGRSAGHVRSVRQGGRRLLRHFPRCTQCQNGRACHLTLTPRPPDSAHPQASGRSRGGGHEAGACRCSRWPPLLPLSRVPPGTLQALLAHYAAVPALLAAAGDGPG